MKQIRRTLEPTTDTGPDQPIGRLTPKNEIGKDCSFLNLCNTYSTYAELMKRLRLKFYIFITSTLLLIYKIASYYIHETILSGSKCNTQVN